MNVHDIRSAGTAFNTTASTGDSDLLTALQVSMLTAIPVSTLHDYAVRTEAGQPALGPVHVRLGPRRRRWLRRDVTAWIEQHRVVGVFAPTPGTTRSLASGQ
ncbi:Uncharacterised protein [Mycobacteroides abscessus subsp. bolletii]|nr:Uncharacterised protein [Mycobacteroides abscessus subsp. bolletii]SKS56340.1 Uncharacterised protein [Mycobacteroides abscessus subsp. bolletii]